MNHSDILDRMQTAFEAGHAIATREAARRRDAEIERLRAGIKRLASPEAFVVSRICSQEETARMKYAEALLS